LQRTGRVVGHRFAVADEDARGLESAQRTRRKGPDQRMKADPFAGRTKERDGSERIGADERAADRLPQRHFPPPAPVANRQHLERYVDDGESAVMDDAESVRPRCTAALVTVEQLENSRGLAERSHTFLELWRVDRVDEPDAPVDGKRV
jgi:hypothetical protein